jgi:hypothetical protein
VAFQIQRGVGDAKAETAMRPPPASNHKALGRRVMR